MSKVQPLPMDVHCDVQDTIGSLRPQLKWPATIQVR